MADLIVANDISGLKIYGQQQVDYTVDSVSGRDFAAAVARASMLRSVAVEHVLSSLSEVVRLREKKLTDLAEALSIISSVAVSFDKDSKTDDMKFSWELGQAKKILDRYGIDTSLIKQYDPKVNTNILGNSDFYGVSKGNSSKVQTDVQYERDKEDNYLQQDLVSVPSYFSKRDQALSTATSLVKKVNNTMTTGVRSIS